MISLVNLAHHSHGWLLSLVMLATCLWHVVLLGRRLLVHHWTLVWLHVHVWSGTIVAHRLPLAHSHLILHGHTLRGWHRVIIAAHRPMATRRHVHGTVRHVELVRSRSLHRHMVRSRHLAVHLVLHVWCRRAPTYQPVGRHVVRARRRGRAALTHPSRTHRHILCGWCW